MDFNMLEKNVLKSALERYIDFCNACLENPENENQFIFIEKDLEIAQNLLSQFIT